MLILSMFLEALAPSRRERQTPRITLAALHEVSPAIDVACSHKLFILKMAAGHNSH
jgi:hypothetical protein